MVVGRDFSRRRFLDEVDTWLTRRAAGKDVIIFGNRVQIRIRWGRGHARRVGETTKFITTAAKERIHIILRHRIGKLTACVRCTGRNRTDGAAGWGHEAIIRHRCRLQRDIASVFHGNHKSQLLAHIGKGGACARIWIDGFGDGHIDVWGHQILRMRARVIDRLPLWVRTCGRRSIDQRLRIDVILCHRIGRGAGRNVIRGKHDIGWRRDGTRSIIDGTAQHRQKRIRDLNARDRLVTRVLDHDLIGQIIASFRAARKACCLGFRDSKLFVLRGIDGFIRIRGDDICRRATRRIDRIGCRVIGHEALVQIILRDRVYRLARDALRCRQRRVGREFTGDGAEHVVFDRNFT